MLNCLIIDDELIARRGIERYVDQISFLTNIGSLRTAGEAVPYLEKADLMILDIQMPQLTGLDFLKSLHQPPVTIILTAYPEYALRGFELDVIDYMVKPVSYERFLKACTKAKEYIALTRPDGSDTKEQDYLFIKADRKIEKIFLKDILFIEAKENYSCVHTVNGNYLTLVNLGIMEGNLNQDFFMRVHKSFVVSMNKINRMEGNSLWVGLNRIPISRRIKKELKLELESRIQKKRNAEK